MCGVKNLCELTCQEIPTILWNFFTKPGYKFNNEFTDENAICMIIGDDRIIYAVGGRIFQSLNKNLLIEQKNYRNHMKGCRIMDPAMAR